MKRASSSCCLAALLTVFSISQGEAAAVQGTVRNGSTGKLVGGAHVLLIKLQGGMETVANTKTDQQGRYRFEHQAIGQQPMLIRVVYRGINFHQSVSPGRTTANVEVFDPTSDPKVLNIPRRIIVVQPQGATLLVGEEYTVENRAQPAAAFYKADGSFEFEIPENASLTQVVATGPSGMPTVQGTLDRGKNRYAIAFAFRPGESGVRLSYQIPYPSNHVKLTEASIYPSGRVMLVAPPSMEISGAGFEPAGSEQGWRVYARDQVPAGLPLELSISGTAPPPSASGDEEQQPQGRGSDTAGTGQTIQVLPSRLSSLRWVLVGGFAALFFLGLLFLWRKPAVGSSQAPVTVSAPAPGAPYDQRTGSIDRAGPGGGGERAAGSEMIARADGEVSSRLDQLKDLLFRLELRRQAGTISEQDYASERQRMEKLLHDLVKG